MTKNVETKMKNFPLLFGHLVSFIIGYILLHNIIQIFLFLFLIFNNKILQIELTYISLLLLFLYLVGGVLGIRSFNKKDENYEIWKPSKSKLLTTLGVAILYSIGILFYDENPNLKLILVSLVTAFIISYPFSALLTYFYKNSKNLKNKIKWVMLLLITNPIFTVFLGSLNSIVLNR